LQKKEENEEEVETFTFSEPVTKVHVVYKEAIGAMVKLNYFTPRF
jgi:hypothetical protein